MSEYYILLAEAARRSGLHINTLKRLLRMGVVEGYKENVGGRSRWLVSAASLRRYTHPLHGFLLDLPGPKLYLRKNNEDEEDEDDYDDSGDGD